jgi:hypothetical protein
VGWGRGEGLKVREGVRVDSEGVEEVEVDADRVREEL